MKKNSAVFLDRDGTINEEVGYLNDLEKLIICPGTFQAIRLINESGMKAVVITNQSGVAREYFSEDFVVAVHSRINEILSKRGAYIDRFYYCPHHPTEGKGQYLKTCNCRKPETGMVIKASEELDIDLNRSYMVGDTAKDIQLANKCGAKGIMVKTGYGKKEMASNTKPDYIAEDILDAVKWILEDRKK